MTTIIGNILLRNWFGLAIAVIALYFLSGECSNSRLKDQNIEALTEKATIYKNAFGTLTTRVKTLQLLENQLKSVILDKNDTIAILSKKFARVETINKVTTITNFDTIEVPFKEPIPCDFVREDTQRKEWYSFNYRVDNKSLLITDLKIPNTQIAISGMQRKWFLGKQTIVTEVTNTNPNIITTNVSSIRTVIKPKWYESKLATFLAGAVLIETGRQLIK